MGRPASDRISVPGRTQACGRGQLTYAYRTSTFYGRLFNTVQLVRCAPLRRAYNPDEIVGLGCSAFARHY